MNNRLYKIQDLLHKEIASLILSDIKDPLLNKSITISSVKVSKDIRYAEIFFTTIESDILKKILQELSIESINQILLLKK